MNFENDDNNNNGNNNNANNDYDYNLNFNSNELLNYLETQFDWIDEHKEKLVSNHVDGESFLQLNNKNLNQMDIKIVGHKLRIFRLIREIKDDERNKLRNEINK